MSMMLNCKVSCTLYAVIFFTLDAAEGCGDLDDLLTITKQQTGELSELG